jgi:putative endopeptidase
MSCAAIRLGPPELRRNGVIRNIDAFYGACGAGEDDALYAERGRWVRIWN